MKLKMFVMFVRSGGFVGKSRARTLGCLENGRANEKPAARNACSRHDAIQTLSIVHSQHDSRDEMFGKSHVCIMP